MPVIALRRLHVPVLEPLLQLPGAARLIGREPRAGGGPRLLKVAIEPEHAGGFCRTGEQIPEDLLIHRRAHHQRRAERMRIFG